MAVTHARVRRRSTSTATGRPRQIDRADIVAAGCAIGMDRLSLNAVAQRLGVTATALYRHVDGRWGLEQAVGEAILSELRVGDEPDEDASEHLLRFAMELRAFALERPGIATYLQTLFPRGEAGRQLLADQVAALTRRGWAPDAAIVLCSSVACLVIGLAASEEVQRQHSDGIELAREDAWEQIRNDEALASAHLALPEVTHAEHARLVMTAAIGGLVAACPPGRAVTDIITKLSHPAKDI